ncbi:MAG: uncharacterized protein QOH73_201 [Gaiellaceae bacterium]|jgi:pimeloyl-ACP methyl ester carboxylesterase|nr:uncharacterized protein [Gaiellaceae bacterium]
METRVETAPDGADHALLQSLRSHEHATLGIRETFLTPEIGGAPTVAVLAEPLGAASELAWLVCHSQGLEQRYIEPLEVEIARTLAARGFRVLRFHCQGYGDSATTDPSTSLASHLRDTTQAVDLLRELGGAKLGFVGGRFGGAVAALMAERCAADALVLWDPVVTGKGYLRNLLRQDAIAALTQQSFLDGWSYGKWDGQRRGAGDRAEQLESSRGADLDGLTLSGPAVDELVRLDLTQDLHAFDGAALVVQVSRATTIRPELRKLEEHLTSIGATCTLETAAPAAGEAALGSPRYVARGDDPDGRLKRDLQAQLSQRLIGLTADWVERVQC